MLSRISARTLAGALTLALAAVVGSAIANPAATPGARAPAAEKHKRPIVTVNGIPDTGQYLPDTTVLVRVDARRFTAREYVAAYFDAYPPGRPATDSLGRVDFLHTLVNKELLGRAARKVGYDLGYEGRVQMRENRQRALSNMLYQRAVLDSAVITEADVLHVYEQEKRALRLRHILFADRLTAERVRIQLVRGLTGWKAAVAKYSKAKNDRAPDGDMGWVLRPSMNYALAEAVYSLRPGEISPIIEDANGPQIIQCVEVRAASPPDIESMRKTITQQVRASRLQEYADRMQNLLSRHVGLAPDTVNINWACRLFPQTQNVIQEEGATTFHIDVSIPEFQPEDTSRVLARWKGGRMSLGQFMSAFSLIPPAMRPPCNTPEDLSYQVANVALEPYKEQLAIERGLEKEPAVVAYLDMKLERALVERMYDDSITAHVLVSKAERQKEYDVNRGEYMTLQSRTFATILRRSQAGADSVVAMLRSGQRAEEIITADSLAGFVSGAIHVLNEDEHGPFKKIVYEEMKQGDITTMPADKNGAVAVVQLIGVTPARQLSFEESQGTIDEKLRSQKAEDLLQALIKRLSVGHDIRLRPELVMKINMANPTL